MKEPTSWIWWTLVGIAWVYMFADQVERLYRRRLKRLRRSLRRLRGGK